MPQNEVEELKKQLADLQKGLEEAKEIAKRAEAKAQAAQPKPPKAPPADPDKFYKLLAEVARLPPAEVGTQKHRDLLEQARVAAGSDHTLILMVDIQRSRMPA